MINYWLVWYLQSNNLIYPLQSVFRFGRNKNDHLVRLETSIRNAFINLGKAYNTN